MDIKELRRLRLKEWFSNRTLPIKDKSYISQIVTGKSSLGEKAASRLELEYNMPPGYLTTPSTEGIHTTLSALNGLYSTSKKYPVLNASQARMWAQLSSSSLLSETHLWLESEERVIGDAFWLKVESESMTAPSGLSIPEGSFVLFDTGREVINGSLVIADLEKNNSITIKKLIIDSGQRFLKALNPVWPAMTPIDEECRIIGVGVEAKIKLI